MLEIVIVEASSMREDEKQESGRVAALAFAEERSEDLGWCGPQWVVLGRLEGRIVCRLGLLQRVVRIGASQVAVGGVGGVATHPDFQRQGYAGQILQRAAKHMRETLQVPFGVLVCAPKRVPYYSKLGWQPVPAAMYFDFRGESRLFTDPVMYLPLSSLPWPQGDLDLQGRPW